MDRFPKTLLIAALALLPLLAACTETPETELSWGMNDRMPVRHRAAAAHPSKPATTRTADARTYIYQDKYYAGPAPRPTPLPPPHARSDSYRQTARNDYRPTSYQPPAPANSGSGSVSFAWPVNGEVISAFGADTNGARNDGINIAARMNAPIRAAASGTVSYSGNELRGYGNLVLIKHADGYVTAYAHADRLLVTRGDFVAKGQVIGYAGQTGDVASPQLHFEIRHDTTPVNPRTLLAARAAS